MKKFAVKPVAKLAFAALLFYAVSAGVLAGTGLTSLALSDVDGYKYEKMIEFLESEEIIGGYPDGTFKPNSPVNRVEFLKVVLESTHSFIPEVDDDCGFLDVDPDAWYTKYVCLGKTLEIINGYSDGTFKPEKTVSFVEAAKIAELGYDYDIEPADTDAGEEWYRPYVSSASDRLFIPPDVDDLNELLSRGQISELLGRFVKYDDGALVDYFGEADMGFVLFDPEADVLEAFDKDEINVVDFMAGNQVIDFSSGNTTGGDGAGSGSGSGDGSGGVYIPPVVDSEWLSLPAGDTETHTIEDGTFSLVYKISETNPAFLSGTFSATGDGDSEIDIAFSDDKIESTVNYKKGSSNVLVSTTADAGFPISGAYFDEVEDVDYIQSVLATDGVSTFGWAHSFLDGIDAFAHSFDVVSDTANYSLDIGDASYAELVNITGGGLDFTFEDSTTGGTSEEWSYHDPDQLISIAQTVTDDGFFEHFTFEPTDDILVDIVMDDGELAETFLFDQSGFDLDVTMEQDDYTEVMAYEEGGLSAGVTVSDIGTTDMSLSLIDGSDQLVLNIDDNVLTGLTYIVAEDDDTSAMVSYFVCPDFGPSISGLLYDGEEVSDLFYDSVLVDQDLSLSGDKISLTDSQLSLTSSFGTLSAPVLLNESDEKELGDIDLSWESAVERALTSGSFGVGDNLLKKFSVGLDLGDDEEDVDEADADDANWKWYKKHRISLGLNSSSPLTGTQDGKVKGHGLEKDWHITLSPTDAEAEQNGHYKQGALEKDFRATVKANLYGIEQNLSLGGKFGDTYVGKNNSTTVTNGDVSGSQSFELDSKKFKKNLSGTYGDGQAFGFTQKNKLRIGGIGLGGTDVDADVNISKQEGKDPTVTVGLSGSIGKIGGVDLGLGVGASFGGEDGNKPRPSVSLTGSVGGNSPASGWGFSVGAEKGPEDSKPRFTFGIGKKF